MGANQQITSLPRYTFEHGADFEVKFIEPRDVPGSVVKDVFAVTGGGAKVYFEMMRRPGQEWGFGDIKDPYTGRTIWSFRTFMQSDKAAKLGIQGMKGDMTPVCGDDNRTYVDFRTKSGQPITKFLLAEILPRWTTVASMPVPPLPVFVADVPEVLEVLLELPRVVPEVVVPASVPVVQSVVPKKAQSGAEPKALSPVVLADVAKLRDRLDPDMLDFVTGPFARMMRAPAHLRLN